MSQCKRCNGPDFTLNRDTGDMTCNSCGTVNLVGSPNNFGPLPEFTFNKKTGDMDRVGFLDNTNFDEPTNDIGK